MGMIEKVARAMYEVAPYAKPIEGEQWPWETLIENNWAIVDMYRQQARAALEAMLEPDMDMLEAARHAPRRLVMLDSISAQERLSIETKYQAMIRKALEEE